MRSATPSIVAIPIVRPVRFRRLGLFSISFILFTGAKIGGVSDVQVFVQGKLQDQRPRRPKL